MRRAERNAPGEAADAVIWEEVISSTGEDSTLTWVFMAFMVLACLLAAIGIATNSPITIVGAMVVGPEFGPLAAIAVGLRLHRMDTVRRGIIALVAGFAGAIAAIAAVALVWRATGLMDAGNLSLNRNRVHLSSWLVLAHHRPRRRRRRHAGSDVRQIGSPGGVFISVTTIPAAGNLALALVLGRFHDAAGSAVQLVINLTGIVAAAYLVLLARGHSRLPDNRPSRYDTTL